MKFSKTTLVCIVILTGLLLVTPGFAETVKVAIVLPGAINDHSWNQTGYEGLMRLKNDYKFEVAYSEKVAVPDYAEALADYSQKGFHYVIGHGGDFGEAIGKVAPRFPGTMFVGHNCAETSKNIAAATIDVRQIGYVMGYLGGKMSKTGKGGFINAFPLQAYVEMEKSFSRGFKAARPGGSTFLTYTNDWDDIAKGKEAALNMITQGADVIFPTMDRAIHGSIQACKEKGAYAIGLYYDAYSTWPDTILNSALVNWVEGMVEIFSPVYKGKKIEGKSYVLDLNYPKVMNIGTYNPKVPEQVKKEVAVVMGKLKSGELKP